MAKDGSLIFLMSRGFESLYIPQVSQPGVYFAASSLSATKMHSFHGQFPNFLLLNPNATFSNFTSKCTHVPRHPCSILSSLLLYFLHISIGFMFSIGDNLCVHTFQQQGEYFETLLRLYVCKSAILHFCNQNATKHNSHCFAKCADSKSV